MLSMIQATIYCCFSNPIKYLFGIYFAAFIYLLEFHFHHNNNILSNMMQVYTLYPTLADFKYKFKCFLFIFNSSVHNSNNYVNYMLLAEYFLFLMISNIIQISYYNFF